MINKRHIERCYPYVFGLTAGFVLWHFNISPTPTKFDSMLTSAISVSAILLGFLGTAKAMLLGFRSSQFTWMKKRPLVWSLVLSYLKEALLSNFIVCLCSLLLLSVTITDLPKPVAPYLVPVWTLAFTVSVSTFYRVVSVFFTLLKSEQG
jgi:hypothetical protein